MIELVGFALAAAAALVSAAVVLLHRNPVVAAMSLIVNLVSIAVLFLMLGAQFVAALQVIVYAGAIMVLIVFVIMLLGLPREPDALRPRAGQWILAGAAAMALAAALLKALSPAGVIAPGTVAPDFGTAHWLAGPLFSTWFWPFEILSLVLLAAMAGAVLLAKRDL